jgi:hypothetical protein
MTKPEAMKLMELFNHGYVVFPSGHRYGEGPANIIKMSGEDNIVYSSNIFCDRSLLKLPSDWVEVYHQRVHNWTETAPAPQEIH